MIGISARKWVLAVDQQSARPGCSGSNQAMQKSHRLA